MSGTASLLVVEDDLTLVQFIDAVLGEIKPGIGWEYVTSGERALELLRTKRSPSGDAPYRLVICDIFLEGDVTGFEVWRECQAMFPQMPFVVTTGLARERYASLLAGAPNRPVFLPKPLTINECQSVFEEFLT